MKIGVLIATYNGEDYIIEQLESIVNQTVKVDEIVISDDCSIDNTDDLIREFIKKGVDIEIKYVKNQTNHGIANNFHNAFVHSSADFLFLSDQDDKWLENKVEIFLQAVSRYPGGCLFFSDAVLVDSTLKPIGKTLWDVFYPSGKENLGIRVLDRDDTVQRMNFSNFITGMSMGVKREVFERVFPIDSYLLHDECIALYSSINHSIISINSSTSYYRQHEDNTVGITNSRFVSNSKRRNNLYGLVRYSYQNIDSINYLYVRSKLFYDYDVHNKYSFIEKKYSFAKRVLLSSRMGKVKGMCKLLHIYFMGDYKQNLNGIGNKQFILDCAMMLFVSKKKRREKLCKI